MLQDITLGQYYPGNSFIHRLDPRTKIIFTLLFIAAIFMAESAVSYGVVAAATLAIIVVSRLSWSMVFKSLKPLAFIIVLTLVLHLFMGQGEHVIWSWSFINITQEGLELGVKMSLRLVLLLLISSVLTFTTSPIVLTDGIESLLRPLARFGVPAHELAMMMTIALRFIPTLLDETDRIMKAQTARGADFGSGNIMHKVRALLPLLVPLFISAFRRADELAVAMEARCYRGGEGRTRMHELKYTGRDAAAFVAAAALLCVLLGLRFMSRLWA